MHQNGAQGTKNLPGLCKDEKFLLDTNGIGESQQSFLFYLTPRILDL